MEVAAGVWLFTGKIRYANMAYQIYPEQKGFAMQKEDSIVLFKQHQVRRHWDDEQELWYFSIVDVIAVLTGSDRPRKYWNDLKKRLFEEGSESSEKIGQLKMGLIVQCLLH
jgi:hypothetical protein